MSPMPKDEKGIFETATRLKTPAERSAYLDRACADDPVQKARIVALLQARDRRDDFLDSLVDDSGVSPESDLEEGPGTVIGRYKLLEKIGEGGMAVVYLAEQAEPIRRKVALKIIKLGMDTRQVIARFEAERQALALMDHPSIAKVLDAGATETSRPYFVMELVQGVSITDYCDKNSLSTKDRLGLFLQVCHAVQHAHQKGIIHRDIKPSNVMVTHHDGKPVPKVIDFGIAKAMVGATHASPLLTEKTFFTRYGHLIGTPAYMSPEQAELSDLDIDTRSDIYSLGVLLYELLTGTTPFSEEELRQVGYLEMQRVIREQEPVKPSTRIRTATRGMGGTPMKSQGPLGPASTGGTPVLLMGKMPMLREVRGDLDWIVMKSLEKDRTRRYETASGLAEDIRRHLESEPVLARGPSAGYRLRKFLRRHRSEALAVLVLALGAAGVVVGLSLWNRGQLQLAEAEGFRHQGILSRAREQYARAERETALATIQPILRSRHVGPEAQLLQAGILVDNRRSDEAMAIVGGLLSERPEVAGAAHSLLARILWESGSPDAEKFKRIDEHRRQAEELLPETAEAYFLRAMTAVTIKEQLAALDRALQLDPKHYESLRLRAFTYCASRKYDRLQDDGLVMTILRPRDPLGYSLRAIAWRELGRYREAMADYEIALAFTPRDDPQYDDLTDQRRETLLRMGAYERVIAETPAGARHLSSGQYHVFCALTALGRCDEATALFREIIAPGHEACKKFREWCMKYVFDTLEAGRSWRLEDQTPVGAAFLPMIEAEETYRSLSAKGQRLTTGGFSARWSPDGSKLAFSLGVQGYSGVALFDPATRETELLIVPGKDPRWSPDGRYIAFVRDRQNLRLEELLTPEPGKQRPPVTDEEVWLMKSNGTEPRRLAQGSWPSWGSDSQHLYYLSRGDTALCSVSLVGQDTEPKRIMKCVNVLPSVSPDNRHVAHFESGSLKITDLASQKVIVECRMPSLAWGVTGWSPSGNEVCLGGGNSERDNTGLWLYDLQKKEFVSVLGGQIAATCWSPAGTELTFCLGTPYLEIWSVPLASGMRGAAALGPGQTLDEHLRDMLAFYTRRIEADPNDAYAYSGRAHYHDCLGDQAQARADMRQWSAILSEGSPQDSSADAAGDFRRVISISPNCEFVFSAERPVNGTPMMSVAFGQKGRCEMKLFEIPMFIASLFGFGLLSGLDVPPAYADFTFGEPVNLKSTIPPDPVNDGGIDCFSYDGLEVYFTSLCPGGYGDYDLWVSKRATINEDWGPPENLGPAVNGLTEESCPSISADGLALYFSSNRVGAADDYDIYVTTRVAKDAPWGPAVNLGPAINQSAKGAATDAEPWISPDGLELYFESYRPGGYGFSDIYVARRVTTNDPWGQAVNLGPVVNTPYREQFLSLSPDGLVLLFGETRFAPWRPGGYGGPDLWMTRRISLADPWQTPVNLGPTINGPGRENIPRLAPDGHTLYFISNRGGNWANWQAPILPIVDFDGDGQVDGKELLAMIVQLGGNDPRCDIGPYAWGDGKVDVEDLKVLAEYIGKEVVDGTLIAHWKLDEKEGALAHDSAGKNDGMVVGNPTWQPGGGKVGGALAFDGKANFVPMLAPVLDPAAGPFSVLAWVKGGAPNRVIVSQLGGANWLYLNQFAMLTTDLQSAGKEGTSLTSTAYLLDDQWHRVAFVWDGTNRALYADGVEVARDTQPDLAGASGKFQIGGGRSGTSITFWSGLIDDVRIYSRAVTP